MKVKELIEKLSHVEPDSSIDVECVDSNGNFKYAQIDKLTFTATHKFKKQGNFIENLGDAQFPIHIHVSGEF